MPVPQTFTLGLISDTHGLLRDEALALLSGSDHIIHAGDIGDASIVPRLEEIAPVSAIRGNNDEMSWAQAFPEELTVMLGGVWVHVIHSLADLRIDSAAKKWGMVVAGHSHKPLIEYRDDVLFINPGSAGKRRFSLPLTVARVEITGTVLRPSILPIVLPGILS